MLVDHISQKFHRTKILSCGSSLKLCLIAEGKADVYPRFAPTMEWVTAAGQVIIEQAGGMLVDVNNDLRLKYNKKIYKIHCLSLKSKVSSYSL
ncbi:inositol monophosphatase family protein [Bacillus cereus]|uniref:inositol monophosphatase family protein n=1 Tax=Bacillus cereus TaxID=1396 RepID=UPI00240A1742|nr:inositol monophosphatase family protein [Bacillus cereus]